jgi:nucleoside-diphosphate-sugar epimerase
MTTQGPIAAVTGASGYLGSRICNTLESRGWQVRRLVRSPEPGDRTSRRYDMASPIDRASLASVGVLIHAAYDFTLTRQSDIWRVNVDGTRRLVDAARDAAVPRLIVLSTMSAYAGTRQLYGRAKLEIEAATAAAGGVAIRPGLVWSERPAGIAGALQRVTHLPVVPLIAGGARQFPVHVDDLMSAIGAIAGAETLPRGPIGVATEQPVPFREVMAGLAGLQGRRCRFVRVPWQPVYWGLRLGELLRLPIPFRSDSLLGLVRPAPSVPGLEVLASMGVTLRPFPGQPLDLAAEGR